MSISALGSPGRRTWYYSILALPFLVLVFSILLGQRFESPTVQRSIIESLIRMSGRCMSSLAADPE